ncbi:ribokinase [Methylomonas sp. AM2-LC]|uniref:ribokinase n=1 Tax=Methylomonas sp. AM2-LC TaxID=3153301 RepID=UPI0032660A71
MHKLDANNSENLPAIDSLKFFVAANFVQACCWKVPRLPVLGETLVASALSIEAGGKGLNVAIGLRRLGAQVDALLGIGNDAAGDSLTRLLDKENIPVTHVHRLAGASGHGAGLITAGGENAIAVYPGANLLLRDEHAELAETAISAANWVYGQFETSVSVVQRCFELARQHDCCTALNPSPWQEIPPALLAATDILVVNEIEAAKLLHIPDLPINLSAIASVLSSASEQLWASWSGQLLVVTLGELGCVALQPKHTALAIPAFKIEALDSVGAGDAFAAGLLYQLALNTSLAEALRYANACGAMLASKLGVLDVLPNHAQVASFIAAAPHSSTTV